MDGKNASKCGDLIYDASMSHLPVAMTLVPLKHQTNIKTSNKEFQPKIRNMKGETKATKRITTARQIVPSVNTMKMTISPNI